MPSMPTDITNTGCSNVQQNVDKYLTRNLEQKFVERNLMAKNAKGKSQIVKEVLKRLLMHD
jgi:hypothetical protein